MGYSTQTQPTLEAMPAEMKNYYPVPIWAALLFKTANKTKATCLHQHTLKSVTDKTLPNPLLRNSLFVLERIMAFLKALIERFVV
jgi:hypothetical protein